MWMAPWKRVVLGTLILMMLMAGFLMGRDTTGTVASAVSTVAIVRSEQPSAYEITADEIRDLVRRAVALAGGLADVIEPGDTVVLKPNLVEMRDFIGKRGLLPELLSGVATDRRVVAAVAELAHEAGAAEIFVMEGSAISTALTFAHYGYTKENLPYVDAVIPIEEDSGGWREFGSDRLAEVKLADGRYQKTYYLNRRYYEADVVISLPALKNHWDAAVTGAVS